MAKRPVERPLRLTPAGERPQPKAVQRPRAPTAVAGRVERIDRRVFPRNVRLAGSARTGPTCELVRIIQDEYLVPETRAPLSLQPHQYRILNYMFTPDRSGRLRFNTLVWSCPKKSGKTEIGGAVMYAWARTYGGDIYSIANDLSQAAERGFTRVSASLGVLKGDDPARFEAEVHPDFHKTVNKNDEVIFNNGARIMAIPCDPYGEAGGMQTLTLWDELWGYRSEAGYKMWTEMQPLPPGVGGIEESIRFIVTYAGWYGESELLWQLYDDVVQPDENGHPQGETPPSLKDLPVYVKGGACVYWDHAARMPWHTPAFLEQAKSDPVLKGKHSEYLRIWENRWTTGLDAFIEMDRYDQAVVAGNNIGLENHLRGIVL